MQFFAESVCRDKVVLDLRLTTTKRLMGSACLRRGGKARSSQRKLGANEHLNVALFNETEMEQEEPREETDLLLHDDDDDDDAEDAESTGTSVAEAVVPCTTVTSQVEHAERFVYLRCAHGKHPPKP